jgi:hypothetical protein
MVISNVILEYKMVSAKKVMNIEIVEFIESYNFYFDHFFILKMMAT